MKNVKENQYVRQNPRRGLKPSPWTQEPEQRENYYRMILLKLDT
jgi:hypothetical protein